MLKYSIIFVSFIIFLVTALDASSRIYYLTTYDITETKFFIGDLFSAIEAYNQDSQMLPSTDQGFEALIEKPKTGTIPPKWKEGYLKGYSVFDDTNNDNSICKCSSFLTNNFLIYGQVSGSASIKDTWGNQIWYQSRTDIPGNNDNTSYRIISLGSDNKEGGEGSAQDIVFNRGKNKSEFFFAESSFLRRAIVSFYSNVCGFYYPVEFVNELPSCFL